MIFYFEWERLSKFRFQLAIHPGLSEAFLGCSCVITVSKGWRSCVLSDVRTVTTCISSAEITLTNLRIENLSFFFLYIFFNVSSDLQNRNFNSSLSVWNRVNQFRRSYKLFHVQCNILIIKIDCPEKYFSWLWYTKIHHNKMVQACMTFLMQLH